MLKRLWSFLLNSDRRLMSLILIFLSYIPFFGQHETKINILLFVGLLLNLGFYLKNIKIPRLFVWGMSFGFPIIVYNVYSTLRGLNPGIELLTLLALAKSFEIRDRRDFFILALIIELSLIGHLLSVESLGMVFYIGGMSFLLFFLLFSFHRDEKISSIDKGRFKVFCHIFLWSIPLTLVMFIIFPRVYIGNFFPSYYNKVSKIGFSRELNPGSFEKVIADKTPVFRARFTSKKKVPFSNLYWRGMVLSRTDGFNWRAGKLRKTLPINLSTDVVANYEVDFDVLESGPIFTLENTRSVKLKSQASKYINAGGTFKVLPYSNHKIRFSGVVTSPKKRILPLREEEKYLQLPEALGDEVKSFAKELKEGSENKWEAANKLMDYFFRQKFVYTLSPGSYEKQKPLEEFFFEKRRGFCEHYASATAIIFRSMGIPTRVVTGFQGGRYNPLGDYYVISGEDAHAWVEAWFPKKGWIRFDPTAFIAPSRVERGANEFFLQAKLPEGMSLEEFLEEQRDSAWRQLALAFDMVYYRLNQDFLNYDLETQLNLFKKIGFNLKKARELFFICMFLIFIILPLIYLSVRGFNGRQDRLEKWYRKLSIKLDIPRKPNEGPQDYANRVLIKYDKNQAIKRLIELYIQIKYADKKNGQELLNEFIRKVKEFKV